MFAGMFTELPSSPNSHDDTQSQFKLESLSLRAMKLLLARQSESDFGSLLLAHLALRAMSLTFHRS
jgi:hypothetical protein